MKTIFLLTGLLFSYLLSAQKPERVYSVVKELRSETWYKTQADLWEKETKKNAKNAEAWYNYYSAYRALKNLSWGDESLMNKYNKKCGEIADAAYAKVPKSFEANHLIWWHGSNDQTKFSYLEKAYEINPLDVRTYRDLMIHYVLDFNESKTKEFAEKIYKVNEMPASAYNWAYNILAEAAPNAIIFTGGDNDTYLPWIIQEVLGFRKDVTIMNTSLLNLDAYRKRLFEKVGLQPFAKNMETAKSKEEMLTTQKELFQHIFSHSDEFPVYVLTSIVHQFRKDFEDNLFLVGLTYQYCENTFDNIALIKRNYEKRYLLNYLSHNFSFHPLDKKADDFNVYYLQAFVKLHQHYLDTEENAKAEKLKDRILRIAKRGGQEENMKKWIDEFE